MSRRTALASTAIRKAWEREKELVAEGKGTRDWTAAQQKDILDENIGKAYDEDGKAFEGHHMQSAEAYPQYQGEPLNIQFLTREEHKEAHQGDFRNPTNGYFDPITHTTRSFEDGKFVPCEVISLSDPICKPVIEVKPSEKEEKEPEAKKSTGTDPPKKPVQTEKTQTTASPKPDAENEKHPILNKIKKVARFAWKEVIQPVGQYVKEHPVETIITAGKIVGCIVMSHEAASPGSNGLATGIPKSAPVNNTQPKNPMGNETLNVTPSGKDPTSVGNPLTEEQLVHSHFQRYGKDKHWVEVAAYTRGPKK